MSDGLALREVMLTQRAVRDLRPDAVELDLLLDCIRLATHAPSGSNRQAWEWVVAIDPEVKHAVAELNRTPATAYASRADLRPGLRASVAHLAETMHEVPAIVVPCYRDRPEDTGVHYVAAAFYGSIFPAVQSFLLAAHANGLGATLTTMPLRRLAELRAALDLPEDVWPCCVIPVGWPSRPDAGRPSRRDVSEVVHIDRYAR